MNIKQLILISSLSLIFTGLFSSCNHKETLIDKESFEVQTLRASISGEHINIVDLGADPTG